MSAITQTIDTPDGPFSLLVDAQQRVLASGWGADPEAIIVRTKHRPESIIAGETEAAGAVRAYYAGDLAAIEQVELLQFGTPLQLAGWAELRKIPPGAPLSYSEFAEQLGRPSAVRAAASLCARNPTGLFVPCHRVLRSDGSLGGFAWGLDLKTTLLDREASA